MIEKLKRFEIFTYVELLGYLGDKYDLRMCKDRRVKTYQDLPYVDIRHDVDWILDSALDMAKLESDVGVRSTYHVRFNCPFYNLLYEENVDMVRKIIDLGHEIGLHYDIIAYSKFINEHTCYEDVMKREISMMEELFEIDVITISCHNMSVLEEDPLVGGYGLLNVSDIKKYDNYVSDSNRIWKEDKLKKLLYGNSRRNLLLIHPVLWSKKYVDDRYRLISDIVDKCKNEWVGLWRWKDEKYE